MDNDDKVKGSSSESLGRYLERSKKHFLKSQVTDNEERRFYNLEEEFQKTRKNRSWWIAGVILLLLAAALTSTILITRQIRRASETAQVDIGNFDDINLQDVLDRAKRLENSISRIQEKIDRLKRERDQELKLSTDKEKQAVEVIENTPLSAAEEGSRIRRRRQQGREEREAITTQYAGLLQEAEDERADLQKKLDQYDARKLEEAREQAEIMDNQERLFQIEMNQREEHYKELIRSLKKNHQNEMENTTQHYQELIRLLKGNHRNQIAALILKFNPRITDEEILSITGNQAGPDFSLRQKIEEEPLPSGDYMIQRGTLPPQEYRETRSALQKLALVTDRLSEIPFENDVPPLLQSQKTLIAQLNTNYGSQLSRFRRSLQEVDTQLAQTRKALAAEKRERELFQRALSFQLRQQRESGYIIGAAPADALLLLLNDMSQLIPGDTAIVFRDDDQMIARIKLTQQEGSRYRAEVLEMLSEGETIQPLDKVLITIQPSAAGGQDDE